MSTSQATDRAAQGSGEPAASRPPRHRDGTYAAADLRRQRILEVAMEHIALLGYSNSSLVKIAAEVGISHAGLLHHFGSKQELLRSVLEARNSQLEGRFQLGVGQSSMTVHEYFRRVRAINEYNAAHPGLAQLYTMLSAEAANPEHPAHEYFKARIERLAGFITGVLESGMASGEIRPDVNCSAVANEILAIGEGFQLQLGLRGSVFDITSALDHFLKRLSRDIFVDTQTSIA